MNPLAREAIDLITRGIIATSAVLLAFGVGAALSDSSGLRAGPLEELFLIASGLSSYLVFAFAVLPRRYLAPKPVKYGFLATVVLAETFFIHPVFRNRDSLMRYLESVIDGQALPEKFSLAHTGVMSASLLLIIVFLLGMSAAWQLRQPRD